MFQTLFNQGISLAGMAIAKRQSSPGAEAKKAESELSAHAGSKPARMSGSFRDYYEERMRALAQRAYELNPTAAGAATLQSAMSAQERTQRKKESAIERQQRMQAAAEESKLAEQRRLEISRMIVGG